MWFPPSCPCHQVAPNYCITSSCLREGERGRKRYRYRYSFMSIYIPMVSPSYPPWSPLQMWNPHLGLAIRCSEEFEAHGGPSQVRSPRLLVPVEGKTWQKPWRNTPVIPSNPQNPRKKPITKRRPQQLGAKKTWPSRRLQRGVKIHTRSHRHGHDQWGDTLVVLCVFKATKVGNQVTKTGTNPQIAHHGRSSTRNWKSISIIYIYILYYIII